MKSKHPSDTAATELSDQALLGVFGGADANAHQSPTASMASSASLLGDRFDAHDVPSVSHGPGTIASQSSAAHTAGAIVHAAHSTANATAAGLSAVGHAIAHGPIVGAAAHAVGQVISHAPTAISHGISQASAAISHGISHAPVVSHGGAVVSHGSPAVLGHALTPSAVHAIAPAIVHSVAASVGHGIRTFSEQQETNDHHTLRDHIEEHIEGHLKDIHERFEHATQEVHDDLHQIIDGFADVAHGFLDAFPGHHDTNPGDAKPKETVPPVAPPTGLHIFRR